MRPPRERLLSSSSSLAEALFAPPGTSALTPRCTLVDPEQPRSPQSRTATRITAVVIRTLLQADAVHDQEASPRCGEHLPISTRHGERETTPVINSGITAGASTVTVVCHSVSRITRDVRSRTGLMFFTALSVKIMIGITP